MGKRRLVWYIFVLLVALLFTGCAERERVMVPPRADLQGAKRLAVLDFDNYTADYGLALEAEQALVQALRGYYQVVDRATVEATLADYGYRRGDYLSRDIIRDIGQLLNVDAVITGEVTYYFEDVNQNVPYIVSSNESGTKWAITQHTAVMVSLTGRVTNTRNGVVMYSKRVEGDYSNSSTRYWTTPNPNVAPSLPEPSRQDIPQGRLRAVSDAVDSFTADLLPTYVWRKVEE